MKIKVVDKSYEEVMKMPVKMHVKPVRQNGFWRLLMKTLAEKELKDTGFSFEEIGMERLGKNEPALFLMNHSSFTDLNITSKLLAKRQYHIIMTNDGMVGKAGLMSRIGCIPTKKFISDPAMVKDMVYVVNTLNSSILMFPEASYSFDGTPTPLPDSIGKLVKILKVPVVVIRTKGAFLRDPLYNNLQKRKANVSANVTYLLSKEDIRTMKPAEITGRIREALNYDHFREQFEAGVTVTEEFRADGLERVLFKCCDCGCEDSMKGAGITIRCGKCGLEYELCENGKLKNLSGETRFEWIPDWYAWERESVRKEIDEGKYHLQLDVDILMMIDTKSMYRIGDGVLSHDADGFVLKGNGNSLEFSCGVNSSYSLYADYFWYEIGDMIAIGDAGAQYYCFPKIHFPVAKARLAAEELYKLNNKR